MTECSLCQLQEAFTHKFCTVVLWLFSQEYGVKILEVYRPEETAELYAKEGKGICDSNHERALAGDLALFRGGVYLTSVDDYRVAGEAWKAMSTDDLKLVWGGDFSKPDADHFSIDYHGIK